MTPTSNQQCLDWPNAFFKFSVQTFLTLADGYCLYLYSMQVLSTFWCK